LVCRFVPAPYAARAEVGGHSKMAAEVGGPEASRLDDTYCTYVSGRLP